MVYSRCSIMGNKPRIRFKGFTEDWEQRKFSDITYLSGVKNKENKPYESYSISNEFGFIPQDEQFENGGTMKTANKSMYYIVSQNSFAYNPARINVGSIGYYDKPDNVIVSSLYEVFKTTEIVNDKFLWHWFKSSQFNHLIEKYQEGGVRLYFYYDKLCKGTIELPTINEQNKISNLLDSLDMYITLHQCKLEKLKLTKKALLQKLFPKNGKHIPEIRFKGFTDAWEQRKLLTVLNKIVDYRGRTPKKLGLDWSPTGHLALSALNVKMGYVDKTIDAHYGDDHLYSVWMKDNDLYEGQVLFTTEAPMGNVAQVPDNNKYILSQRTIAFVPDRSVISDNFLAVVLSASKCQKSLINRASGGTAKGVSQKTLSEISLDIPQSLSEQDKVSELIKKLSKIITLHQRKLERLQEVKKGLLQKMFV